MTDAEILILESFAFALLQQQEPLPAATVKEIQSISGSLDTRLTELDDLANELPHLKTHYKNAYRWLTSTAAERGMGLEFLPDDEDPITSSQERTNIASDTGPYIEEMQKVLALINQKLDTIPTVLSASEPVQAAQQEFS